MSELLLDLSVLAKPVHSGKLASKRCSDLAHPFVQGKRRIERFLEQQNEEVYSPQATWLNPFRNGLLNVRLDPSFDRLLKWQLRSSSSLPQRAPARGYDHYGVLEA